MGELVELEELRDREAVFADRRAAGRRLAALLVPLLADEPDRLVLAVPCGGVPVGLEVAAALACPLELAIVRKLPIPGNPEAGFGAMTLAGALFLDEALVRDLGLSPARVEAQREAVGRELLARNRLFRGGRPPPDLAGRVVVLVDDGLASGMTMRAGLHEAGAAGARRRIVAVPTAPRRTVAALLPLCDLLVCPNVRGAGPFAVAGAYRSWRDLGRGEVLDLLARGTPDRP